jgi:DNA-binding MarR family transcriptional regulator
MTPKKNKTSSDIQNITSVDKLIHEPARLNIMTRLYVVESADFLFMMRQTGLTFGNLSAHMSKLEEAGYIEIIKEFVGKKPHTMLKLTEKGRRAFDEYRKKMKQFFNDMPS